MAAAVDVLLTLNEAAGRVPVLFPGRPPVDPSTIRRWITRGIDGVRLRGVRLGSTWLTAESWLTAWAAEVTEAKLAGAAR